MGGNLPSVLVDGNDPIFRDNPRIDIRVVATLEGIDTIQSDPLELSFTDTCASTEFIARNIPTIVQ